MKKTLRRLGDNYIACGELKFVEYNQETSRGIKLHDSIFVGGAALVDFDGRTSVWQTSQITEKISETEFKTRNSHYVIEDYKKGLDELLSNTFSNYMK